MRAPSLSTCLIVKEGEREGFEVGKQKDLPASRTHGASGRAGPEPSLLSAYHTASLDSHLSFQW